MVMNKPVIKAKLHNAAKTLSNEEKTILSGANTSVEAEKAAKEFLKRTEAKQDVIDHYNNVVCQEIDPFFSNIQIGGKDIIVRLHKENFIKDVKEYSDGVPMYNAWISQVDGRQRQTDPPTWVDNPLPYIMTGVVVAMSPGAIAAGLKELKDIQEIDPDINYELIKVGDIVQLEHFMFADKRYYKNEQKRDYIKNPKDYAIENWEGYVKIHFSMIKSKVLDKETFKVESSPLIEYRSRKQ